MFFVQNLPSTSHEETEEYSGDDEEVKQATKPSPRDTNKTQSDKDKVRDKMSRQRLLIYVATGVWKLCIRINLRSLCFGFTHAKTHKL